MQISMKMGNLLTNHMVGVMKRATQGGAEGIHWGRGCEPEKVQTGSHPEEFSGDAYM